MENRPDKWIEIRYVEEKNFSSEKEIKRTFKTELVLDEKDFKALVSEITRLVMEKEHKRRNEINQMNGMLDG